MLTADVALYSVLKKLGLGEAKMMAGHSLGEYAALVSADAISLAEAAVFGCQTGPAYASECPFGARGLWLQ